MTSNAAGGKSILDAMVTGVMAQKTRTPAATLSPTPGESKAKVAPLDGKHQVMFPYDDPQTVNQAILDGFKQIEAVRQSIDHIYNGLVALAGLYGTPVEGETTKAAIAEQAAKEQRAKEAAADAKAKAAKPEPKAPETPEEFKADFAQKQAEAQAAVFGLPKPVEPLTEANSIDPDADDDDEDEEDAPAPDGWVCPTHKEFTIKRSARRQVDYRACPKCDQFERV